MIAIADTAAISASSAAVSRDLARGIRQCGWLIAENQHGMRKYRRLQQIEIIGKHRQQQKSARREASLK